MKININVNEIDHQVEVEENLTLLNFLRGNLGLYGSKNGCNKAQCGACTVLVDGIAKRSCVLKMSKLDGAKVETVENLSKDGKLHPVQIGFVNTGAIQCGFCTPGMIMSAKGLLDKNVNPSDEEIKKALKFNICRCTGYVSIINAVKMAAKIIRGEEVELLPTSGGVGVSVLGKDLVGKATGLPIYGDDKEFPNMLFGKILYTKVPYGIVKSIDISKALKAPGVEAVITAEDIPGRKSFGLINPHQPVMVGVGEKVKYMGDSVATVFATSLKEAEVARDLIEVIYEELEGVYTIDDALKPDHTVLNDEKDLCAQTKIRRGDISKGFEEAEFAIEGEFVVPPTEHAYMEPEVAVTKYNEKGQLEVFMPHQGAYDSRKMIAATMNLSEEDVIMKTTPAGGGFGGKEEPTVNLHAGVGTYVTKKPCKITMTREESLAVSTKRHGEQIKMKYGYNSDGKFVAFEGRADVECGAYDSLSGPVVFRSGVVMNGPYEVEYAKTDSIGHYTNTPPGGAFRGFGSTQVTFGAEILVDEIAEKLGMHPIELRLKNALETGKQGITGQILESGVGLKDSMIKVYNRIEEIKGQYKPSGANKKIGIGYASSFKNVGIGIGLADGAGAILELKNDGTIMLKHGAANLGQGPDTTMALIVETATGIPTEKIDVINNITPECPDGEETTASRQTFVSGNACKHAGYLFKNKIAEKLGINEDEISFDLKGISYKESKLSYEELAKKIGSFEVEYEYTPPKTSPLNKNNFPGIGDDNLDYKIHYSYTYGTHGIILEVDEVTGEYKVLKVVAGQDLGKAIHPLQSIGQIEGAVVMGLGYAMSESFITERGLIKTDTLGKLKLPKITDLPEIEVIMVEDSQIEGPFGAKGMGELPINPVAPAISNAIKNAIGVRIKTLPITKEKVRAGIEAK